MGDDEVVDVVRLRPGVVTGAVLDLDLPKDVSVTITKEGSGPAKITVKKEGKVYEATEDKLSELPKDVVRYVQMLRGAGTQMRYTQLAPPVAAPPATKAAAAQKVVPVPMQPYGLPTHSSPEAAKVYRYHVESRHGADDVDSKLDQILKILAQKEDSSVSTLRKEVQQLRKELDELRKEKK